MSSVAPYHTRHHGLKCLTRLTCRCGEANAVARLCQQLGMPTRLRDVDVPEAGLEPIAAATLHDQALATNPRPMHDAAPILQVLRAAW